MTEPFETVKSAQGKDISNHNGLQPVSSWNGFQFGFAKATEGTGFLDQDFAGNWVNMKRAGIHRGAYHFFHPAIDPVAQAKFFFRTVQAQGLLPGDMLVADVEITSGNALTRVFKRKKRNNITQQKVSLSTVNVTAKAFLDEVKRLAGSKYPILVYTDLSVGHTLTSCAGYPLWIAFPSSTSPSNVFPWKKWTFWQWGQTGVDRDAFNGTAADLQAFIDSFASPAPTGPFKHTLTADTSVKAIADLRKETVAGFYKRQMPLSDADAAKTVLKAGSVYLTLNP